jgi:hypothetical protein
MVGRIFWLADRRIAALRCWWRRWRGGRIWWIFRISKLLLGKFLPPFSSFRYFILPALAALRSAYPNAELILLNQDWHADFLRQPR